MSLHGARILFLIGAALGSRDPGTGAHGSGEASVLLDSWTKHGDIHSPGSLPSFAAKVQASNIIWNL